MRALPYRRGGEKQDRAQPVRHRGPQSCERGQFQLLRSHEEVRPHLGCGDPRHLPDRSARDGAGNEDDFPRHKGREGTARRHRLPRDAEVSKITLVTASPRHSRESSRLSEEISLARRTGCELAGISLKSSCADLIRASTLLLRALEGVDAHGTSPWAEGPRAMCGWPPARKDFFTCLDRGPIAVMCPAW